MNQLHTVSKKILISMLLMAQAFVAVDAAGRTRATSSRPAGAAAERLLNRMTAKSSGPLTRRAANKTGTLPVVPVITSDSSAESSQAPSSPRSSSSEVYTPSSVTISEDGDVDTTQKMSAAEELLALLPKAPTATRNAITAKEALWRDGAMSHDDALKTASRWKNSRYKELFIQMIMENMHLEKLSDEEHSHVEEALARGEGQTLSVTNLDAADDNGSGDFDGGFDYDGGDDYSPASPAFSVGSAPSTGSDLVIEVAEQKPLVVHAQPSTTEETLLAMITALRQDVANLRKAHALKDARDVEAREAKMQAKALKHEAHAATQRRSRIIKGTLAVVAIAGAAYTVWYHGGIGEVLGKISSVFTPTIIVVEKVVEKAKEMVMPTPVDPMANMNFISKITYRIAQGINIFNPFYTV
ncbi:hypothetical protein FJ365_00795 [Candidatus Dependentiae bacterium]|nr:hypothetical protein [Candidatus Dependentiae bacterium]